MMKRLFIICLCFILLVAAFGCKAKPSTEAEKASSVFQATIIEIKDGAMLVKPVDGYPEANYAELINVIIQHMSSSPEPKAGDIVEITYNGIMTEEDPPSPCGVETIKIVSSGSVTADESLDVPVQVSDVGSNQFEGEFIEVKPQCPPSYGVLFWLPADWTLEVTQSADDPTRDLIVSIRPEFPGTEGVITLRHIKGFGVCGTGLEQKDIEFNGHPARQGFYDGNTLWSHIILKDPKDCVIINSAENWYEEYEEEINKILSTVEFVYYETDTSILEPAESIIDSASFDIDGDGIIEDCKIAYGPTSGLFTVVITASVDGNIKYKNTFNLASGNLSFGEKDGSPCIIRERAQDQDPKTEHLPLSVQDGRIVIDGLDPVYEGYWGGSEWNYGLEVQMEVCTDAQSYVDALSEKDKQKILDFAKEWYAQNFPNYKDMVFEFAKDSDFGYTQYPQYKPGEMIILKAYEKDHPDNRRTCFIAISDSGYEVFNEGW